MRDQTKAKRAAGVEADPSHGGFPPVRTPSEAFYHHFTRCFFCRFGDRYTEDHFCEEGRELNIAVLDECAQREWDRRYEEEWDFEEGPF